MLLLQVHICPHLHFYLHHHRFWCSISWVQHHLFWCWLRKLQHQLLSHSFTPRWHSQNLPAHSESCHPPKQVLLLQEEFRFRISMCFLMCCFFAWLLQEICHFHLLSRFSSANSAHSFFLMLCSHHTWLWQRGFSLKSLTSGAIMQ